MFEKLKLARVTEFFKDVRSEMKKVSWPGKKEVYGTTVVVIVAVFFFGVYLGLLDTLLRLGMDQLFKWMK